MTGAPIDMHPPADLRCQIYVMEPGTTMADMARCSNEGTHWVKWAGCSCPEPEEDICEADFYSWECDESHGPHTEETAA